MKLKNIQKIKTPKRSWRLTAGLYPITITIVVSNTPVSHKWVADELNIPRSPFSFTTQKNVGRQGTTYPPQKLSASLGESDSPTSTRQRVIYDPYLSSIPDTGRSHVPPCGKAHLNSTGAAILFQGEPQHRAILYKYRVDSMPEQRMRQESVLNLARYDYYFYT